MKATKILLMPILAIVFLTNCEKPKEDPEYVGTWSDHFYNYGVVESDTNVYLYKYVYELKANEYTFTWQVKYNNSYVIIEQEKGSLKVEDDLLVFIFKTYGQSSLSTDGKATGNLTLTDYTTSFSEADRTYKIEFLIDKNELFFYEEDLNQDGDKKDVGEFSFYVKTF